MKNRVQTTLVIALLCAAGAISIHADGSDLVYINTSYIDLPEQAPLEAECKVRAEQAFAGCMQFSPIAIVGPGAAMFCQQSAANEEIRCLNSN